MTQPPYSPDLVAWDFWLFLKLKSLLKGKKFETINEIHENSTGQLMAIGRTVWGPKVFTLKWTEASLSYIQCFLYLVFSSIMSLFFTLYGWVFSGQTLYTCIDDTWSNMFNKWCLHKSNLETTALGFLNSIYYISQGNKRH